MKFIFTLFVLINIIYAKTNIVVSILPQQTFVEKIGGEKVTVTTMVKPGSDPHTYEPKPSQMKAISKAQIYFPINLEFENNWLNKFKEQNKNMQFVDMTKNIELIPMQKHSHGEKDHNIEALNEEKHEHHHHEEKDPHIWTSPSNVKIMAKNIYDTLIKNDPINQEYYKTNYMNFLDEINKTDKQIRTLFLNLSTNSKFMVFHPSWGYFAKEYGLIQLPIEFEGKEPKPKMLQYIINEAKEEKVKAIFTQLEFSDKSSKTIAEQLNIKVLKQTPLAANWSENLIQMAKAIANHK
ncbi:metal ABC transporter solute-binding protein, Zn/Mn family [Arcobacter sp.]|uniref:metal ABC transporter solute-binding protein, Zn/Mn family n=1 Tax=Arcobacter sp. TaxID=1872629 RepID=UPI003D119A8F